MNKNHDYIYLAIITVLCTFPVMLAIYTTRNIDVVNNIELVSSPIIEEEVEVIEEIEEVVIEEVIPSEYISLTQSDRELLACAIYLEGGNQSIECQYAIGSCIINRLTTGSYESIHDVLYAPNQFAITGSLPNARPRELQLKIVDILCEKGPNIPVYVKYFRANYYHSFGEPFTHMDETYFSYSKKDRDKYFDTFTSEIEE